MSFSLWSFFLEENIRSKKNNACDLLLDALDITDILPMLSGIEPPDNRKNATLLNYMKELLRTRHTLSILFQATATKILHKD